MINTVYLSDEDSLTDAEFEAQFEQQPTSTMRVGLTVEQEAHADAVKASVKRVFGIDLQERKDGNRLYPVFRPASVKQYRQIDSIRDLIQGTLFAINYYKEHTHDSH